MIRDATSFSSRTEGCQVPHGTQEEAFGADLSSLKVKTVTVEKAWTKRSEIFWAVYDLLGQHR